MKKGISKKTVPIFISILFQYLKKEISKKTVPGILRFVSMLFNDYFSVSMGVIEIFGVCKYPFLT